MRIWYDFEFIENGSTIQPISIGMVADDDREYYAVFSEINGLLNGGDGELHERITHHHWLMENVIPHLPLKGGKVERRTFDGSCYFSLDTSSVLVRPGWLIANEVREFVLAAPDPELWGWYADYDHVVLSQLYGSMIRLPEGFPMYTRDVKQEADRLGNPEMPKMPERREHHALDDAREIRYRHAWLERHEMQGSLRAMNLRQEGSA